MKMNEQISDSFIRAHYSRPIFVFSSLNYFSSLINGVGGAAFQIIIRKISMTNIPNGTFSSQVPLITKSEIIPTISKVWLVIKPHE